MAQNVMQNQISSGDSSSESTIALGKIAVYASVTMTFQMQLASAATGLRARATERKSGSERRQASDFVTKQKPRQDRRGLMFDVLSWTL